MDFSKPNSRDANKAAVDSTLRDARKLVSLLEDFDGNSSSHEPLLEQVDKIRASLETPYNTMMNMMEKSCVSAALYALIRIQAFEKIPEQGSVAATDMAAECGVDVSVITHAMSILTLNGIGHESQKGHYTHNAQSRAFHPASLGGLSSLLFDFVRGWGALPEYVKSHNPEDLYDTNKTPFASVMGLYGKTFYEVIDAIPALRAQLDSSMQETDNYISLPGLAFFTQLEAARHCTSYGAKLILQDLPGVIASLEPAKMPGIEAMAYDMFTPQPIKDAHVYMIRRLLMDFSDEVVVQLLRIIASAMGPKSWLVVIDTLGDEQPSPSGRYATYWGFMGLTYCGKVRSVGDFEGIFDKAGLGLFKVYRTNDSPTAILGKLKKTSSWREILC
ncbi:hypothetical protein CDD80_2000 [Ophiocordyceps camponoti-rufipedis]|uniref:O-methyltransferase C-terminal domain-containing protein n=1 Tax=Ophiocordyceps camponoti-rufipedis TaxID=2004952 RepID=A0A2C5Z909_9HYPO|nr:hypothetical protein CDD80_2000 [Ophiocordyceps camponoti-rufipedis]